MGFYIKKIEKKVKPVLNDGEKITLMFKQSLLSAISPTFVVATDQRLIIINNSFWGLYAGFNIFGPTEYNYMLYGKMTSVVLIKGRILASLDIRLLGGSDAKLSVHRKTEGEIDGMRLESAITLMKFIEEKIRKPEESKTAREGQPKAYKAGRFSRE
jgi:hypothetical protein